MSTSTSEDREMGDLGGTKSGGNETSSLVTVLGEIESSHETNPTERVFGDNFVD